MPRNVEIKAQVRDWDRLHAVAAHLAGGPPELIRQVDTFFHAPHGRLKLREFSAERGELIFYERPDAAAAKTSRYEIVATDQPQRLRETLAAALGIRGVVRKERLLYLAGQSRIHLDRVEGLGRFVELEVVLRGGQTATDGRRIAEQLQNKLGISDADLVEGAYVDLIR
ncbi:MAG: class IV adenylate cyclase [Planctomycetes bacterium]|nr:class IV adenylate cyclase [Planctomycetota bacterium]